MSGRSGPRTGERPPSTHAALRDPPSTPESAAIGSKYMGALYREYGRALGEAFDREQKRLDERNATLLEWTKRVVESAEKKR